MKLEMKQRMEQTDFKKLADEARKAAADLLIASKKLWTRPVPGPAVHGRLIAIADAIDALLAERDALHEANKELQNRRQKAALRIEHSQECNYATAERSANRAKLVKATEAMTAINEYRPPDYEEEPYVSVASFCKTKARAVLAAIKETTSAG